MKNSVRWFACILLVVTAMAAGCEALQMLPTGPVIDAETREVVWGEGISSGVTYREASVERGSGEPPVLPMLVFGLRYDLDVVVVSKHPKWEMHEVARIRTPDGPIWIAKDTRMNSGDQMLVTDLEQPNQWLPEIPLARRHRDIRVTGAPATSAGQTLDLRIKYRNYDDTPVEIRYRGPVPVTRTTLRNGSTMGHSRRQVMAVLDLPVRNFGQRASVQIGGEPFGVRKAAGLVPLQLALEQTQGGIPDADFRQKWTESGEGPAFWTVHRMGDGDRVRRRWQLHQKSNRLIVRQQSPMRRLEFVYLERELTSEAGERAYELLEARVIPWTERRRDGSVTPAFRIRFRPALPDLRFDFAEAVESRFVMDVGGQQNHAVGYVQVESSDSGARVEIRGHTPRWVARRCGTSVVDLSASGTGSAARHVTTNITPCP